MKMAVSALLVSASLLASAPASAADYIKIQVIGTGFASSSRSYPDRPATYLTDNIVGLFEFVLPSDAIGSQSASSDFFDPNARKLTVTASSTALQFTTTASSLELQNFVNFNSTVSICGDFSGGIPAYNFSADPSCSTASYDSNGGRAGFTFRDRYSGTVDQVNVIRFSADSAQIGLASVPALPEPATWATMLIGFGMVAATARARRRLIKFTYA